MLTVSITAAYLDYLLGQLPVMSVFVAYFVLTSWLTVKRGESQVGRTEIAAFLAITVVAISLFIQGWLISVHGSQSTAQMPTMMYFIWGTVAIFAALLDLILIVRGGHHGKHRVARHLWRMCLAFLMAIMSFLAQDIFPDAIKDRQLLWVPVLLLILLMFFWLFRVLFTQWRIKPS